MTSQQQPVRFRDPEACAEAILSQVGARVVLAMPLGLGKANHVANALYARAAADPSISLEVLTALTLGAPRGRSELERRLLRPFFARLAGDYPELAYALAQRDGRLPPNVIVHDFFLPAGRRLDARSVQQNFIAASYTHIVRDILARGVNVAAQLVARKGQGQAERLSLSCNPDLAPDLVPEMLRRREAGARIAIVGQVNDRLPFMPGPADVAPAQFDMLLDSPDCQFELFPVPKQPVPLARYAAALHAAALIEDGGTLQIGIGSFADGLTQALKLRHQSNADFRALYEAVRTDGDGPAPALEPFREGLYASSEMLVEGLLALKDAGVVKRRVPLTLGGPADGPMIHAGFFLGAAFLYERLRTMPEAELNDIAMTAVSFVNRLYGDEALKRAQRVKARFINNALIVTLLGHVVSDALEDGRVVSGVGGQYNFVAMAHELDGARAIITVDATHISKGRPTSSIRWSYGNTTIPRYLRDIVVTEYGAADLRGLSDRDVIAAMLGIADSRFQPALLAEAKAAGKIEPGYEIPESRRRNYPERIEQALAFARAKGLLPHFPIGSDMTPVEEHLTVALSGLKEVAASRARLAALMLRTALGPAPSEAERAALERLGLAGPAGWRDRLLAWAVLWALRAEARD